MYFDALLPVRAGEPTTWHARQRNDCVQRLLLRSTTEPRRSRYARLVHAAAAALAHPWPIVVVVVAVIVADDFYCRRLVTHRQWRSSLATPTDTSMCTELNIFRTVIQTDFHSSLIWPFLELLLLLYPVERVS